MFTIRAHKNAAFLFCNSFSVSYKNVERKIIQFAYIHITHNANPIYDLRDFKVILAAFCFTPISCSAFVQKRLKWSKNDQITDIFGCKRECNFVVLRFRIFSTIGAICPMARSRECVGYSILREKGKDC